MHFVIKYKIRNNKLQKIFNITINQTEKKKKILDTIGNFNTHYTYKTLIINKKKFLNWFCLKSTLANQKLIKKLTNNFFIKIK